MKNIIVKLFFVVIFFSQFSFVSATPEAQAIIEKSLNAFYYPGDDLRVSVNMRLINTQGDVRERDMVLLRKNINNEGNQKYYIYFHSPSDVKGTSFMVWKYTRQEDDRWIFIPAVKLVRRIAADDKRSSFIGSDFTYEDVSGRNVNDEEHRILNEETFAGRPVYLIESTPKSSAVDYKKRLSWIDKERWIPLKEQYMDANNTVTREFTADAVELIDNLWSVTVRTMKNTLTGHRTEVRWTDVKYNIGLTDDIFSERYLRNPSRKLIR